MLISLTYSGQLNLINVFRVSWQADSLRERMHKWEIKCMMQTWNWSDRNTVVTFADYVPFKMQINAQESPTFWDYIFNILV